MYIHTANLTQHTEQDIRALCPNTSFPSPFVPPAEYAYIFPAPSNHNSATQTAAPAAPELTVKGTWEQRWTVTDLPQEVIAANAEAARIASIPRAVSRRQIKQALTRAGLRAAVEAAVAAGDQDLIDWYAESLEFERNHPAVIGVGVALGVTELQLDDLWILAGSL